MPLVALQNLLACMREHPYAVQATASRAGMPQAAVVGVVVNDGLEVFFDTLGSSRKIAHLRDNPRVALVFGGTSAGSLKTLQFEGEAREPAGVELDRWLGRYFERFPDGRARRAFADIAYVVATPRWLRYSDFSTSPPTIVELDEQMLRALT